MRWKLLARTLWHHHRAALVGLSTAALALGALPFAWFGADRADEGPERERTRLLLDRLWFDELPEERRQSVRIWLFASSGIGLYREGSAYRFGLDFFELYRNDDELEIEWLQDGVEDETDFEVTRCDDRAPFDLCLTFEETPRGPRRYYGFSDDAALTEHAPWAAALRARHRLLAPR
ncbi:MAG TPA: hypothetical protein RMH99_13850 [Sandaracinaceae bacterium LLY-WYZ-13_1]|nr:hypothetical protein [Sandaracinaceae bacterium LLY-WYZ-13_1]